MARPRVQSMLLLLLGRRGRWSGGRSIIDVSSVPACALPAGAVRLSVFNMPCY